MSLPKHIYSYEFSCSACGYSYVFRQGFINHADNWRPVRFKYSSRRDPNGELKPKLSEGWCLGCDRYVVIAIPSSPSILYRYEGEAEELEELRNDLKLPFLFSFFDRFGRRRIRLEQISQEIQDLHLKILNHPTIDIPDRCLYCGSENTVEIPLMSLVHWLRHNHHKSNHRDLDIRLRHKNCEGIVTVSEKEDNFGFDSGETLEILFDEKGQTRNKIL